MRRVAQQIAETPSLEWVVNTAVTLANVAGTKLDLGAVADAQLAIDALAALVERPWEPTRTGGGSAAPDARATADGIRGAGHSTAGRRSVAHAKARRTSYARLDAKRPPVSWGPRSWSGSLLDRTNVARLLALRTVGNVELDRLPLFE